MTEEQRIEIAKSHLLQMLYLFRARPEIETLIYAEFPVFFKRLNRLEADYCDYDGQCGLKDNIDYFCNYEYHLIEAVYEEVNNF